MNEIVALLEALRPILERWYLLLFAIVLVTLLGIPVRILVSSLAALLRVPAVFARAEIDPPLRRATPTAPYRLLRNLRDYFPPVLDRPARAPARALRAAPHPPRFLPAGARSPGARARGRGRRPLLPRARCRELARRRHNRRDRRSLQPARRSSRDPCRERQRSPRRAGAVGGGRTARELRPLGGLARDRRFPLLRRIAALPLRGRGALDRQP